MPLAHPAEFFRLARNTLFGGSMTQSQVSGTQALLDAWDHYDFRWVAYGLATAYHETAQTMEPIAEYGHGRGRPYGVPDPVTGQVFYGRGFVQITWRHNYNRANLEVPGFDLVNHPDNALKPEVAAVIMVRGLTEGWFTGLKLENYFPLHNPKYADWLNARRIVNGIDCAARIAIYGQHFRDALEVGGYAP